MESVWIIDGSSAPIEAVLTEHDAVKGQFRGHDGQWQGVVKVSQGAET